MRRNMVLAAAGVGAAALGFVAFMLMHGGGPPASAAAKPVEGELATGTVAARAPIPPAVQPGSAPAAAAFAPPAPAPRKSAAETPCRNPDALGVSRVVSMLDDARDAVRNAGLLLLVDLTSGANEDLRKIVC